jgi:Na+-translocating ferredoxin:NAD+ oxidoreductase RNF subunit RnfB
VPDKQPKQSLGGLSGFQQAQEVKQLVALAKQPAAGAIAAGETVQDAAAPLSDPVDKLAAWLVGTILLSVLILGGVGFTFAALITLTHKKFWVWEDPRIEGVADLLPGTNCGACGLAGCHAFAEALIADTVQPATCTVMGADDVLDVADYLGVEAGEANKQVARLLCAGGANVAVQQADYIGLETCKAAVAVAGGGKGCTWGCVGLADCEVVCDFDAIYMNPWGRRLRRGVPRGSVRIDAARAEAHRAVQEPAGG